MIMNNPHLRKDVHSESKIQEESKKEIQQIFYKIPSQLREIPTSLFLNYPEDVLLTPKAYLGICLHAIKYANPKFRSNQWLEVIGFLMGRSINRKGKIPQVLVQDCYPIGHGSASFVEVDNYQFIPNLIAKDEVIVGWYHSHPNFGLFMSNEDYNTQLRYQKQWKYSVGLVIDPTLISSMNYGIDIFRLNLNDLKHFELVAYRITGNFPPKSIRELYQLI